MSANDEPETMLTIRGDAELIDRVSKIIRPIGGLTIGVITAEVLQNLGIEPEDLTIPGYYDFSSITNADQWLGREHVVQFHQDYVPDMDRKSASHVFGVLINPKYGRHSNGHKKEYSGSVSDEDIKKFLGLVISTRADVGFPPLPKIYYNNGTPREHVRRVVTAGSIVTFQEVLENNPKLANKLYRLQKKNSTDRVLLESLAQQLKSQIDS